MLFDELNEDNFILYAMKFYDNPNCEGVDEFYDDVNRMKYLMRLFGKYHRDKELKVRLILNHLVVLYNVFDSRAATRMLTYKMKDYDVCLKTFLFYLNYLDPNDTTILDQNVMNKLREI